MTKKNDHCEYCQKTFAKDEPRFDMIGESACEACYLDHQQKKRVFKQKIEVAIYFGLALTCALSEHFVYWSIAFLLISILRVHFFLKIKP
ncbi:MAG: hypothetical protein MK193_09615 [Lentisphaeria bacterium]|nr:hypothetical protein [Lentisphaeria bacterium]